MEDGKIAGDDRISVCVCTFKRPNLLARLLDCLADQVVDPAFWFDVVVVDNDRNRSAEETVRRFSRRTEVETTYDCEPERNISLARNRAIRSASGNLVALIDDDEFPGDDWLVQLYRTLKMHNTHGVVGPVLPDFPPDAPSWLRKGRLVDRRRLHTGVRVSTEDARTGNVLLRRSICEGDFWFDPAFGRTGGEDSDFFSRQLCEGRVFVWCDEAPVYEAVPPERWRPSFYIKRHLRSGTQDGEWMRAGRLPSRGLIVKNVLILCGCVGLAPLSLLMPKQLRVHVLRKLAYCGGIVTAYYGLSILKYRD